MGVPISSLPLADALTGAEQYPIVQNGTTKRTTLNASGVAYDPAGTGAVATTAQSKLRETVSVKDFGAVGDGVADDTAAVQAAINYCLSFPKAKALRVDGMCRITTSLIINRPVDTTVNEFHIIGDGASGFYVNSTVNIFDSTLPMPGVDPQSEFVTFVGIRFEAGLSGVSAYTLTRKFLRMKFIDCYWLALRLIGSDTYLQSFYFQNCNMRAWPGVWAYASHCFDTHFSQCVSEFSSQWHGQGWLTTFPNGSYSLTFRDGVHEGSSGGLVAGGNFRQLTVDGYYMEGNATSNIDLGNGPTNYSVSITNNYFQSTTSNAADPNFWDVNWWVTLAPNCGGNTHYNGRLHNNSSLPAGVALRGADGDTASIAGVKDVTKADHIQSDFTLTSTLGGETLNYARYIRSDNTIRVEFSVTFPTSTSGSPAVLVGLPAPALNVYNSGTVDYTDYATTSLRVINGNGYLASGSTRLGFDPISGGALRSYADLSGKTVVGTLVYRVD